MENLPTDVIMFMMLDYGVDDILVLCRSNKRFNNILCNNNTFWMNKVYHDYGKLGHVPKKLIKKYKNLYTKDNETDIDWKKYYENVSKFDRFEGFDEFNEELEIVVSQDNLELFKILLNDTRLDLSDSLQHLYIGGVLTDLSVYNCKNLDTRNKKCETFYNKFLKIAIDYGSKKIVKFLLENKLANPTLENNDLVKIAISMDNPQILDIIFNYPIDVTKNNNELIIDATIFKYENSVKKLLEDPRIDGEARHQVYITSKIIGTYTIDQMILNDPTYIQYVT